MGQGTRRHVTPEFKAQTVKLVTEGGHALSQVAADLGIRASLWRRWRRDHEDLATPAKNNAIADSSIPSFHTMAKVSVITRDCCRISAYRLMRGVSLCSGMFGIRS
jgi:hypothetical protein